jgi:hypothetical protein
MIHEEWLLPQPMVVVDTRRWANDPSRTRDLEVTTLPPSRLHMIEKRYVSLEYLFINPIPPNRMLNHFPFMLLLLQEDAYLKEAIKMSLQESGHQGGGSAAPSSDAPQQNGEANLLDFFDEAPAPAPVP